MKFTLDAHRDRLKRRRLRPAHQDGDGSQIDNMVVDTLKGEYVSTTDAGWMVSEAIAEVVTAIQESARQLEDDPGADPGTYLHDVNATLKATGLLD